MALASRDCCFRGPSRLRRAFTLVELLVVVSIIALLISILLPSLRNAREQAKATQCAANCRQIGQAMATYLAEHNGVYPPSYVYPINRSASWSIVQQSPQSFPNGYLHWSHFLYSGGKVGEKAFQCPTFPRGGAPRTNPGRDPENWNLGEQEDDSGTATPNIDIEDRQAVRMAYTANAAIVPRNKFTSGLSGGPRLNILVQENMIRRPSDTILATEYLNNWKALGESGGSGTGKVLVKAHRPVNVFFHTVEGGWNEYLSQPSSPGFMYGIKRRPVTDADWGVVQFKDLKNLKNVLRNNPTVGQINAVGRHHPGGDKLYGGTTNFLFCDTHVERTTVLNTMKQKKWGERYYSLTGDNVVYNANE